MKNDLNYTGRDRDSILTFLNEYYPNICIALLTGSHLNKKKNTDIDVIIFSDVVRHSYVEKIYFESQEYDVICFPTDINNILEVLYFDIDSRFGAYRNMILSSKILFDENNVFPVILNFIQEKGLLEYGTLQNNEIYKKLILISNSIKKLEKIESFEDKYIAFQILENTLNLILAHKKSTIGNSAKKLTELKFQAPKFYSEIAYSIEAQDLDKFKAVIFEQLDFYGGIIEGYSPKQIPTFNDSNTDFEIIIDKVIIKDKFDFIVFLNLKEYLKRYNIMLDFFYFLNNFLVINCKGEVYSFKSTELIIKVLNSYFKAFSRSHISIRKKRFKTLPFINKDINDQAENDIKVLFHFLNANISIYKNRLDRYNLSFSIVKSIINNFPKEIGEEIIKEIISSNISCRYDDEVTRFNYKQLVDEYNRNLIEINLLSETLLSIKKNNHPIQFLFIDFFKKTFFSDEEMKSKNSNNIFNNDFMPAPIKILTKYIKLLIDTILPDELCVIANVIMIEKYGQNVIKNKI